VIEYLRLGFGTALVLLPGLVLGTSVSEALAWTMAGLFVAWAVVFLVHASVVLAAIMLAVFLVGAVALRRKVPGTLQVPGTVLALGALLGMALWHVAGAVVGDGLFHEGRVRKLVELGDLHLRTVDEFKDGGLHPGYAFPLWHSLDAVVAWLSGLDPSVVMRHEPSLLAPLAVAVAYEAGVAVFASRAAGAAVALADAALYCFAPGHGGAYAQLAQPGSGARQLLVPAAIALFFQRRYPATVAIFGALALVHPTYAAFLLVPLLAIAYWEWRAYLAALVPVAAAVLWLRPLLNETNTHNPSAVQRANDIAQYRDQLVVSSPHHFRLAAEVFGRSGAVAVAALLLLPVTALAIRMRWGRFVLGGGLIVLALMELPWAFVHFSDAVSLSQSRRAAGFWPLPFAFAGGLALVARRVWAVPLALVAGAVLQHEWPGDFAYGLRHGGPAWATWWALGGGLAALVAALAWRGTMPAPRFALGAWAAAAFVLPVVAHGVRHWSPAAPSDPLALSPRLLHNLRAKVPKGEVVLAPVQVSYRIEGGVPVYVVAAPLAHVANTRANHAVARYRAVHHWVLTNDPRVAARYGATWAIRRGRLYRLGP
jgi:hypothetical protein